MIPFQFDIRDALSKMRRLFKNRVGAVTLNLPFFRYFRQPE